MRVPIIDYLYAYRQEFVESWPKAAAATNGLLYDPVPGGAPRCIQQAPWTFQAKTADYPQLKPAP
jgi:hypothetical protein